MVPIGKGDLTVVSDGSFMTNSGIGKRDHALALAHLAKPAPGGKVWLLYDSSVPWLGALLWAAAPGALLGAAALIPFWLWSFGARLGPLEPPPDRRRRDLAEHLEANGTFLWKRGLASRLVEPTRKRVLAAWQRRRPDLRELGPGSKRPRSPRRPVCPRTPWPRPCSPIGTSRGPSSSRRNGFNGSGTGRAPVARLGNRRPRPATNGPTRETDERDGEHRNGRGRAGGLPG